MQIGINRGEEENLQRQSQLYKKVDFIWRSDYNNKIKGKTERLMKQGVRFMNIAVVDDSQSDRKLLISYIKNISYELNCKTDISAYSLGENFLEDEDISTLDAVFLDIYMGMKNGMEVAKSLREKGYQGIIIFCTTSANFALEGYSVKAVGYIVKPFTYEKIAEQMRDIMQRLGENTCTIRLKEGRQWYKVTISDILYVEKHGNYVYVHTFGRNYSIRMALGQIEELLSRYNCFVKCDRGIVVNLENVKELEGNMVLLKNNDRVTISRSNKSTVSDRYFDFIFEKME